jgi:tRNA(Ile)-lysidine synthase TilS/MesJ
VLVVPPKVPKHLAQRVERVIDDYDLVDSDELAVATSGGKDSVFACLSLRELGFSVVPVVIDMEFTHGWGDRVRDRLRSLEFDSATVVNARRIANPSDSGTERSGLLRKNLLALDSISSDESAFQATPCTSCYNSKVLAIEEHFDETGFEKIAFAHHATDAISSFLKSALMYIDRWDHGNVTYERGRFLRLCRVVREKLEEGDDRVMHRLRELTDGGLATTDEPPRQPLRAGSEQHLIRPLLGIWESEIEEFVLRAELVTEPSGCGHSVSASTQTPRELVQYELVRPLEGQPVSLELRTLAMQNVDREGRLTSDARRNRDDLLGPEYKKSVDGVTKL